jgi:glycosyltransferase involved in cell wall biosynthesis
VSDLLVTTHTPVLRSGQMVRTYGVARALAAHGGLTLLYVRFEGDGPDRAFRSIPGVDLREVVPSRGARRAATYARAALRGVPRGFARGISPELIAESARIAVTDGCDRVIADGPIAAAALTSLSTRRPVIYNAHNLESSFREEIEGGGRRFGRRLAAFERGVLARSEESWMVSETDIRAAKELCPGAKLRYVPNVVDVAAIAPVDGTGSEQRALFVANFAYEPNRTGLSFLLERVFPLVWDELPDARLALVGAGLAQDLATDERVEVLGFVEDLADAYRRAACAVVPLLQGGGTPLKFIEALAYGLPVIATPRAAAGLAVRDGVDCLLAEDERTFAAAIVEVMRSGAPAIGARGRELALARYSIDALTAILAD